MARWRSQFAHDGFQSHRCMHACWHGKLTCPFLDCRETVMGPRPRGRTVCESVGQRLCDGASSLLTLDIHRVSGHYDAAHMLARVVDAADVRLSRNGDGAAQLSSRNLEENADCRGLS